MTGLAIGLIGRKHTQAPDLRMIFDRDPSGTPRWMILCVFSVRFRREGLDFVQI